VNSKPTILVIDDDDAVRDSIGVLLRVEGFIVRSYPSSAAFLREAQLDQNCCLIVDMHMPGMDGLALLQRLRREGFETPAIVMTGNANETFRQALRAIGGVLLEKPFRLWEMLASISAATGKNNH